MTAPNHPLTIKWALFSFRGRISRKSFWFAALGVMLVHMAIYWQVVTTDPQSGDAILFFWGLVILALWISSAWIALALGAKRLHDLDLPGFLAVCLLVPAIAFLTFLILAIVPSKQVTNRHGPPPFPKKQN